MGMLLHEGWRGGMDKDVTYCTYVCTYIKTPPRPDSGANPQQGAWIPCAPSLPILGNRMSLMWESPL
jgi:hypothetical protein